MRATIRLSIAFLVLTGFGLPSQAVPTTLRDGGTEVVIDPASQDGISVWSMNGVDHAKKIWYWLQGTEFTGSIDQLDLEDSVVTDSDGDGDDDTLVVRYSDPEDEFDVEIAWRLQDQRLQLVGPPAVRHSSLTTQIVLTVNVGTVDSGGFDMDLVRYVDMDLGGTLEDERITIGPANPAPFDQTSLAPYNQAHLNLMIQENVAGQTGYMTEGFGRYRSTSTIRPPQRITGGSEDVFFSDADTVVVDVSDYPVLLTQLNTPGTSFFDAMNNATQGTSGNDQTWSYLVHIDMGRDNSHGLTFVEELEASGVAPPDLPGLIALFEQMAGQQLIEPVVAPWQLGLYGLVLNLAVAFDDAGADGAKCVMLGIADRRSDGQPQPSDWVQGNGLPMLQDALKDVGDAEGCSNGQLPIPTDNPQ